MNQAMVSSKEHPQQGLENTAVHERGIRRITQVEASSLARASHNLGSEAQSFGKTSADLNCSASPFSSQPPVRSLLSSASYNIPFSYSLQSIPNSTDGLTNQRI